MARDPEEEASPRWSYERLERMQEQMLGPAEPQTAQEKKRARIVRAATALFIAQGYRKTSVSEIAKRASVAKGTVYLYFKSKAELLIHAIGEEKRRMGDAIRPLFDGSVPTAERLRFTLRLTFTMPRDMPLVSRLTQGDRELMAALEEVDPALLSQSHAQGEDFYMELLELAAPGRFDVEERRRRADGLIALGYLGAQLDNPVILRDRSLEDMAGLIADIIVHGALGPHPSPALDPGGEAEG